MKSVIAWAALALIGNLAQAQSFCTISRASNLKADEMVFDKMLIQVELEKGYELVAIKGDKAVVLNEKSIRSQDDLAAYIGHELVVITVGEDAYTSISLNEVKRSGADWLETKSVAHGEYVNGGYLALTDLQSNLAVTCTRKN